MIKVKSILYTNLIVAPEASGAGVRPGVDRLRSGSVEAVVAGIAQRETTPIKRHAEDQFGW